jgi:threonine/homoserine/homoserine lactone efflux protein
MIAATTLLEFAIASILIELIPGPNMTWLTLVAATHGRRSAVDAVLGVALGLAIVGLLAGLGMSVVVSRSGTVYQLLRWAGILYFLYLAWEAWRAASVADELVIHGQPGRYFSRGLINNLLNPKAGLFYIAVLPTFVDTTQPVAPQTVVLTLVYVAIASAIHLTLVLLVGQVRPWLQSDGRRQMTQRFFALAMVGLAVWFALRT